MVELADSVVVVTGGAAGIGRAGAHAFARRGADVVLADVDGVGLARVAREVEALGRRALAIEVDVADAAQMEALAARALAWRGAVALVMSSAGVARTGPITDLTLAQWRAQLDVNLWGVIHAVHWFLPAMLAHGRGTFVNVASMAGLSGVPGLGAYATSKFAVVGLSEALRAEVGGRGIGVTVVCPGFVDTELCPPSALARARLPWRTPEGVMRAALRAIDRDQLLCLVSPEARITHLAKRYAPGVLATIHRLLGPRLARSFDTRVDRSSDR